MNQETTCCVEQARTTTATTSIHRNNYYNIADSILDRDGVYWNDRLIELCSYGDTRSVIELVNKVKSCRGDDKDGFSLDCCHSKTGDTALIAACKNRHYECVECLLALGVDPTVRNSANESVLDLVTLDTHLRNLIMTADCRLPSTTKSALDFSAWIGNSELFKKYIYLADVDLQHIDAVRNANGTPLLLLSLADVERLQNITRGSNFADSYRPDEVVAKLIQCGVDVNVADAETGKTALHYLAEVDSELTLLMMRQIIETKRAVFVHDVDDNLPLHRACQRGNEGAAVLLLHEGADVNARGQGGQTPLHFTASSGSQDLVRILLDCGADVTLIDDRGFTPFDLANDAVVRSSLKEAWAEATSRKQSSSDLDSSIDCSLNADNNDPLLTRSVGSLRDVKLPKEKKLLSMRSLPVLPSISPTGPQQPSLSADQLPPSLEDIIRAAKAHQQNSSSDADDRILANIDALVDRHINGANSISRSNRRSSAKPRLRRWRSTSAGCPLPNVAASTASGVRLPPLHTAVFEVGVSPHHRRLRLRPQTSPADQPGNETSDSESNASETSCTSSSNNRKLRTLQTTMPCRVSLSALMILGARPPRLEKDMSVESISARSTNKQQLPFTQQIAPEPDSTSTATTAVVVKKVSKLKKSASACCTNSKQSVMKTGSASKAKCLGVRRHSVTSFSPERVVTTRQVPSPPKELPPRFDFRPNHHPGLITDSVLQPALKIEPIYLGNSDNSDDERRPIAVTKAATAKCSNANNKRPKKKKSTAAPLKKEPPAKKTAKTKPPSSKKQQQEKPAENEATMAKSEPPPPSGVSFLLDNGVSLRLPLDGKTLNGDGSSPCCQPQQDDQNSLRALSDIIQLSTVVEEDELLASLRNSFIAAKSGLAATPIVVEMAVTGGKNAEADDDTQDAESVSTLTPEDEDGDDELAQIEREMVELGQQQPQEELPLEQGHLVNDAEEEEIEENVYRDEQDEEEAARLVRAASRASSTRNTVVFQEDTTLPPVNLNNDDNDEAAPAAFNGDDCGNNNDGGGEAAPSFTTQQQQQQQQQEAEDTASPSRASSPSSSQADLQLQQSIRWRKGNEIGHGGYGKVFLALTSLGGLIAVKQIDTSRFSRDAIEKEYERIDEEIGILRTLKHPSIVEFYGTSFEGDVVNIFMEFIAGGSVATILKRFGALEEPVFRRYTKQLLKAVRYLHANGIVHRDIKGANVMVTSEGLIKLIDFGCARRLVESAASGSSLVAVAAADKSTSSNAQLISAKGTPYWMAPEVICETGHGRKSDIWSLGCTVFEMATRRPPWADLEPGAAMFAIASGRKPIPQLPSAQFTSDCLSFISSCLNRQPTARPTAAELLQHRWFTSSSSSAHRQFLLNQNCS